MLLLREGLHEAVQEAGEGVNRRGFISGLGALIGGVALDQAIPLGRVWSFPSVIKPANLNDIIAIRYLKQYVVSSIDPPYQFRANEGMKRLALSAGLLEVGDTIQIAGDWER